MEMDVKTHSLVQSHSMKHPIEHMQWKDFIPGFLPFLPSRPSLPALVWVIGLPKDSPFVRQTLWWSCLKDGWIYRMDREPTDKLANRLLLDTFMDARHVVVFFCWLCYSLLFSCPLPTFFWCWIGLLLIRLRNMDMNRIPLNIIILTPLTVLVHYTEVVLEIF